MSNIVNAIPADKATDVVLNVYTKIQFDTDIDPTSITNQTVILADSETEEIIDGVTGYIYGTKTVTFQLFDYLTENNDYILILVGGDYGLQDTNGSNIFTNNYTIEFTTGTSIDNTIPLAKEQGFPGNQPFQGANGIYQIVYDRTGEPVTHVVTTDGQVGPSGQIIPGDPTQYLPPSTAATFSVISTSPLDDATDISSGSIRVTFSDTIATIQDSDITIEAANFSGLYTTDTPVFTYTTTDQYLDIIISNFDYSLDYTVTLSSSIASSDASLSSDYTFDFRSSISPFYSTVALIRKDLGSLISGVTDADITFYIYKYSYYVNENYSVSSPIQDEVRNYVTCSVELDLLQRRLFEGGPVNRKKLAHLEVDYGRAFVDNASSLIKDLEDCISRSYNLLNNDVATNVRTPVKAQNSSRRPIKSTTWTRLTTDTRDNNYF